MRELVRGRLEAVGPTTASQLAGALGVPVPDVDFALGALEHEGFVLRGRFTPGVAELEWCERRLLARIHRYSRDRLRKEIEPVTAADFMRFLLRWQRVAEDARGEGPEGLAAVLELLDGFELPAGAWRTDVRPARMREYDPLWLDGLCLSGEVAWGRLSATRNAEGATRNRKAGPIRTTPVALFRRERGAIWRSLSTPPDTTEGALSHTAGAVLGALDERGASFFGDLVNATGLLRTEVEKGLGELVAWGLVTSDSFAGLRALLVPSDRRRPIGAGTFRRRGRVAPFGVETAGRGSRVGTAFPSRCGREPEAGSGTWWTRHRMNRSGSSPHWYAGAWRRWCGRTWARRGRGPRVVRPSGASRIGATRDSPATAAFPGAVREWTLSDARPPAPGRTPPPDQRGCAPRRGPRTIAPRHTGRT